MSVHNSYESLKNLEFEEIREVRLEYVLIKVFPEIAMVNRLI